MSDLTQLRRFSRVVSRAFRTLDEDYLGRGRPLAASRLLFEIGEDGADVRELRERLGVDSGYLTRLLRRLEAEGLTRRQQGTEDRRVTTVRLTPQGAQELATLNELSDGAAASILNPLTETEREELLEAMRKVARILAGSEVTIDEVDPSSPAAARSLSRYYAELGERFDGGFDAVASAVTPEELSAPEGRFVLATVDGEPVGCGGVRFCESYAEIKRMWVDPSHRGRGIARRILACLEEIALGAGHSVVRLDTNRALREARALYEKLGYREIPRYNDNPYAHHWFEKRLSHR